MRRLAGLVAVGVLATAGAALAATLFWRAHATSGSEPVRRSPAVKLRDPDAMPAARPATASPVVLSSQDRIDVYVAILANMSQADEPWWKGRPHPILVSRTLLDTCAAPVKPERCGQGKPVGRLTPEFEAALRAATSPLGLELLFVDASDVAPDAELLASHPNLEGWMVHSLHEIVVTPSGALAVEGDVRHVEGLWFELRRTDGRWRIADTTLLSIA